MEASILPQSSGYLPYYLLLVKQRASVSRVPNADHWQMSVLALAHSVVCYTSPLSSMRQFSGPRAPTPSAVLAHVYAMHNFYTGVIRLLAAYNIGNRELYLLACLSFAGNLFLNGSELLIWKTSRMYEARFPLVNATVGFLWMATQMKHYLAR
ncbi:hypothetical protein LTS07_000108 [Exophiala sideris]|uniref:Ergosterol biosynthetic protein 28 n=1 Tax=Exophiala sideris TaxID=1016849 RepID=A0ABR0JPT5_9EURO|nr:hypothetical protein LTS07_000108 [Exophiala sideris]KAK5041166.1 hypothetical protein LTR13_002640 [Exophiala sideris]KAK5067991.1 hypothetical protein LTR69_000108 [Exophiala sideris]KAK5187293.1 hypothetical protein LTR44_000108 [Eurotiomycetes sp. CCFEE 6388]